MSRGNDHFKWHQEEGHPVLRLTEKEAQLLFPWLKAIRNAYDDLDRLYIQVGTFSMDTEFLYTEDNNQFDISDSLVAALDYFLPGDG